MVGYISPHHPLYTHIEHPPSPRYPKNFTKKESATGCTVQMMTQYGCKRARRLLAGRPEAQSKERAIVHRRCRRATERAMRRINTDPERFDEETFFEKTWDPWEVA